MIKKEKLPFCCYEQQKLGIRIAVFRLAAHYATFVNKRETAFMQKAISH